MNAIKRRSSPGFTIVELLIVIVIVGILAAITIVAYNGVQARARDTKRVSDIRAVSKAVELYYADNGTYPATATDTYNNGSGGVTTDSKCSVGTKQTNWIPGLVPSYISALPQSDGSNPKGSNTGCYKYWSNGTIYVISAWIGAETGPQTSTLYRRIGFREAGAGSQDAMFCNYTPGMGGGSPYNVAYDLYKFSYTISNSTASFCNETPPAGA